MRINFTEKDHQNIADLYTIKEENYEAALKSFAENIEFGIVPKYLYLVKITDQDLYKIGITNDLRKRLKALQTGNPYNLNYVFAVEADLSDSFGLEIRYLERFLHNNYSIKQIHGEWFNLNKMDVCKIFLFLNSSIFARDLYDIIPGTSLLRDVIARCF